MKRGRNLEKDVLKSVERKTKQRFQTSGLILSKDHPIFGASPDGINESCLLEIKCPFSDKARSSYLDSSGSVKEKFLAQMQLQMHFSKKSSCYFCVANPKFEENGNFELILVDYDQEYAEDLMESALAFWKKAIWPILLAM